MSQLQATLLVNTNAHEHEHKHPGLWTLLKEVVELWLALRGWHRHPPALELVEIGGITINLLTRYDLNATTQAIHKRNFS